MFGWNILWTSSSYSLKLPVALLLPYNCPSKRFQATAFASLFQAMPYHYQFHTCRAHLIPPNEWHVGTVLFYRTPTSSWLTVKYYCFFSCSTFAADNFNTPTHRTMSTSSAGFCNGQSSIHVSLHGSFSLFPRDRFAGQLIPPSDKKSPTEVPTRHTIGLKGQSSVIRFISFILADSRLTVPIKGKLWPWNPFALRHQS